jgi:iron complex outermembrane receptor protein
MMNRLPAVRRVMYPLSAAIVLLAGIPVQAQMLEEIVVTAQKREQSLQDVGVSVTAFTGNQMQEFGFTDTVDIVSMTPGLNYTIPNAEGSQINFFLRGVGLNDFTDANENPVATYVDDIYRGAMGGLHLQMFDLERAEVLRGPQGTLYGRNTTGGLLHFISRRPTDSFEAYGDATLASYGQAKFEGALSGPVPEIDNLYARISLAINNHDGYTRNLGPADDYNSTNAQAGRVQLLWQPNEDFEFLTILNGSRNDGMVGAWQHQASRLDGPFGDRSVPLGPNEANDFCFDPETETFYTVIGTDCFGYRDPTNDPHKGEYDRDGKVKVETWGVSGRADWTIGEYKLTSITGFQTVSRLQQEDTEMGPFPLINPDFGADTDQFTQELQLSRELTDWRWLAGFYYFNNDVDANYLLDTTALDFVFLDARYKQETESWALFGQIEWDFHPQWSLILGARYTEERKELDYEGFDTSGLLGFLTDIDVIQLSPTRPTRDHTFLFNKSTVGNLAKHDKSSFSGKAELDWRPTEDLLIYASFSRGTKSAGFNTGFLDETFIFAGNTPATVPYGEETLHAYELGFKSTLFNRTTRLNASVFYYDYMDFQTFRFELLNQIIFNTDAEVYGAEVELVTSPWEGWDFMFGLSVMEATAENIPSASGMQVRDRRMVAAPDFSLNGMARYEWPMWGGMMSILASFSAQGETYYDIQNHPVSRENGYIIGNARLQYTSGSGNWYAAMFVNNIADEEYVTYTFDFTGTFGFNQQAYGKPRWFGATVGYQWQ